MPEAYFAKVKKDTTWENLLLFKEKQKISTKKPLPFSSFVDLTVSEKDFDALILDISQPNALYVEYASQSTPDMRGIWKCITIRCTTDKRNIVLYTAGRTFPLYIAANVE